ncbi:hypothetical protein [Clostridium sp.]|uniref:hypothetical protein n=1 Tax=Clostridium sp. TaxID=1506 RepID=UPI00284B1727|nr:hypothetical protein [Clostridium sp.]MDR3596518.1 hypothetical protein [Clostridium sp.]
MKNTLLITYDLSQPERNYEDLLKKIKSYNTWARITESSYIIVSTEEPAKVKDELLRLLNDSDKIYVGVISAPAAWSGISDSVSNWLQKYLK